MAVFNPPELEALLKSAIQKLGEEAELLFDDAPLSDALSDAESVITPTTMLDLTLPRVEENLPLSVRDALDLVEELTGDNLFFDGLIYHSPKRTLLRIRTNDGRTDTFLSFLDTVGKTALGMKAPVRGRPVTVGITSMSVHFGLAVVLREFFHDKYFPPLFHEEYFVIVTHPYKSVDRESSLGVAYAYLFELHSTLGIALTASPRESTVEDYPADEEIDELNARTERLRPLLLGPGLSPLLQEFHRGLTAVDPETAILHFVKCIEYVSATVVRERQYGDLRKRLLSSDALDPTASYMDGLMALFEENRQFTKDFEALKLTIERCCDPLVLAKHAPAFLTTLTAIRSTSKPGEAKQALLELAAALSSTRNQVAHAKANYERTGKECPVQQASGFMQCSKVAAEQCIRWYAAQNPELRRIS
jgi:hypothetical protein